MLEKEELPQTLRELPDGPGKLYTIGAFPSERLYLTVVGPRKPSSYGKDVCEAILSGLSGYPISIVSGLAYGIDALAHRSALRAGLHTIGVPGSGLSESVLYPRAHVTLAHEIVSSGGMLISEYAPEEKAQKYFFPKRNRIMAGLSDAVLVIEAEEKSGSLITAYLGLDYNKTICAVPGSIYSKHSAGTNTLLKEGATPVTSARDILDIFGIEPKEKEENVPNNLTDEEERIIETLASDITYDELLEIMRIPSHELNTRLSLLEMKGLIKNDNGLVRRI